MARLTKLYTRTGDDGSTRLGAGTEVPKDSSRVEAYGTVDELNACIGCAVSAMLVIARIRIERTAVGGRRIMAGFMVISSGMGFPPEPTKLGRRDRQIRKGSDADFSG